MASNLQTLCEACERNKAPILGILSSAFAHTRVVLEIGSGTGQHAVYFAANLPHLIWQPSDTREYLPGLRERARLRVEDLHAAGQDSARLYLDDPADGIGGGGAFFLLLDEPEVYGLPPDPVVTTRDLPSIWKHVGLAAAGLVATGIALGLGRRK